MMQTKFSYVQIGAKDYKALAEFYVKTLDFVVCEEQGWLCGKEGICLAAPGFEIGNGPIFGFVPASDGDTARINDAGFAHICFETTDVKSVVINLLANGGSVHSTMQNPEMHPCVYCKDPEGNVVEVHIPFPAEGSAGTAEAKPESSDALKFIHVNLIGSDWEALCGFYRTVFDCVNSGSKKEHQGEYKEQVIGVPGVYVEGQHVLLPGYQNDYPTLEIFTYSIPGREQPCDENACGINCIGFACDNPEAVAEQISTAGGFVNDKNESYILAGDLQNGRILLRRN